MANTEGEAAAVLKLHGMWASPFVRRVELALRVKGIPFEYVEENLRHKSQELLQYNPIHKLVPVVLLPNGNRPLCESLIIIEYIDETWNDSPKLLPDEPYSKAKVRFWAHFIDQKILEQMRTILKFRKEEDVMELKKSMDKLEENMDDIIIIIHPSGILGTHDNLGLLDILICTFSGLIDAYDEALKLKLVDSEKHPRIISWMKALDAVPVVKETIPPHDKLAMFFKNFGKK